MASLFPGYEYDIFISYRQKDNKHDGWVTEFVDNLKGELESTFKEEINVYFDINPHDGLLETHDVDESLKGKLKCLVFIPIISRTYCDPKSFAWEHEFKAFVEQASQDKFGLKVKLSNGNFAGRVLPIRIHDLDYTDLKLYETILGGALRGVEFIYKEPGVNRPLTSEDDDKKNLYGTRYRNQINKLANAIKDIILGLQKETVAYVKESVQLREFYDERNNEGKQVTKVKTNKFYKPKLLSVVASFAIAIIAAVLIYQSIFKRDKLEKLRSSDGRISVAIMPFQNMTNDTIWNVWQDGIQNELINNLTNSEELKVRQMESITALLLSKGLKNFTSMTPKVASSMSQKLDANVLIYGSIKQAGAILRVNSQLINSKTEEVIKSFQIDGNPKNIFHITDSLSKIVKNFLLISKLEKGLTPDYKHLVSTNSPEAYRYFIYGNNAFMKRDYPTASKMYLEAIRIDSNFTFAIISLSLAYFNQNLYEQSKQWVLKSYKKIDKMSMLEKTYTNLVFAINFETPNERIKYLNQLLELDDQIPRFYYNLGFNYTLSLQYDKAIPKYEKALETYEKWGSKPMWVFNYTTLGEAYHKTGQYKKEKQLYKKAEQNFPDDPALIFREAILALTEGDTIYSNRYIEKYVSISKENSSPETNIITDQADIYSEAGIKVKAEEYYKKALSLQPDNPEMLNNLAWFLIDKDINLKEGLKLIDKALKKCPDNYLYFDTKGWGLYKQGKNAEALHLLEKSCDLSPNYNHKIYLHIEEVKKSLTNKKERCN